MITPVQGLFLAAETLGANSLGTLQAVTSGQQALGQCPPPECDDAQALLDARTAFINLIGQRALQVSPAAVFFSEEPARLLLTETVVSEPPPAEPYDFFLTLKLDRGRRLLVGRDSSDPNVNFVITNKIKVSRRHCTVEWRDDLAAWILTDHSTNGTVIYRAEITDKLQKEKVHRRGWVVGDGDVICVGNVHIRIVDPSKDVVSGEPVQGLSRPELEQLMTRPGLWGEAERRQVRRTIDEYKNNRSAPEPREVNLFDRETNLFADAEARLEGIEDLRAWMWATGMNAEQRGRLLQYFTPASDMPYVAYRVLITTSKRFRKLGWTPDETFHYLAELAETAGPVRERALAVLNLLLNLTPPNQRNQLAGDFVVLLKQLNRLDEQTRRTVLRTLGEHLLALDAMAWRRTGDIVSHLRQYVQEHVGPYLVPAPVQGRLDDQEIFPDSPGRRLVDTRLAGASSIARMMDSRDDRQERERNWRPQSQNFKWDAEAGVYRYHMPRGVNQVVIGREGDEVIVGDRRVSRRHIMISRFGDGFVLRSLAPGNNVFINKEEISDMNEHWLTPEDLVTLTDRVVFVFDPE